MTDSVALWRSLLYLPASNPRALAKARTLDADAVILDLEDAVAPAAKAEARAAAVAALTAGGWGHRAVLVRVNALVTPWSEDDFAALAGGPGLAGIVVPKVGDAADAAVAVARARVPVWAMIETPGAVFNAAAIAATPGIAGLIAGTNDLAAALRATPGADRAPLLPALAMIVLAARAAAIVAIDGVFNAVADDAGLRAEAEQARAWGFDGKTLIHPSQVDPVHAVFAPDAAAVADAEALIAAFAAAQAAGQGVVAHAGRMVEMLHVAAAERLVASAAAAAERLVASAGAARLRRTAT